MNILVTGGLGFMGLHCVSHLLVSGHNVRILSRKPRPAQQIGKLLLQCTREGSVSVTGPHPLNGTCELLLGDIRDSDACQRSVDGIDAVIHHAAVASISYSIRNPIETGDINVKGTRNMLQAAVKAGVRRFVFSSSAKIYGNIETYPANEEAIPNPQTPYALSKMAGESFCEVFHEKFGIEVIALRYFSVYGPGQNLSYGYIGPAIQALVHRQMLRLTGDETVERDFTFIDDATEATALALTASDVEYNVINVGSGRARSLRDMVSIINRHLGTGCMPEYAPILPGMAVKTLADLNRARSLLEYEPRVSLEEGLQRTIEWYKEVSAS